MYLALLRGKLRGVYKSLNRKIQCRTACHSKTRKTNSSQFKIFQAIPPDTPNKKIEPGIYPILLYHIRKNISSLFRPLGTGKNYFAYLSSNGIYFFSPEIALYAGRIILFPVTSSSNLCAHQPAILETANIGV